MKNFSFTLRRNTVADPLTVRVIENEIGVLPQWIVDGPSTYRAEFPVPIGELPKQVTTIYGDVVQVIVCEGGRDTITINTYYPDGAPLEAELTDYMVRLVVLDDLLQTSVTE